MRYNIQTNQQFGRWTVLHEGQQHGYRKTALCQCQCGAIKEILYQNLIRNLSQSCGCLNRDIVYTGFEEISGTYWARIRNEAKYRGIEFTITIEEMWQLFIQQKRKCKISGLQIGFAKNTKGYWSKQTTASIDRINSNASYSLDNVQWVHKDINRMKSNFPEEYFIFLCKTITEYTNVSN